MPKIRSLESLNGNGKRVLVRCDLNVPIDVQGNILDRERFRVLKPTIDTLCLQRAKIILLSHFGQPKPLDVTDQKFSLKRLISPLQETLQRPCHFIPRIVGNEVEHAIHNMPFGEVMVLENVRFHPGEEHNDPVFAQQLAKLCDVYVNEAFSCSHRKHASIEAITHFLPSYAGIYFSQEVEAVHALLKAPTHPILGILGGSKISTKLPLLRHLLATWDKVFVAGGIAHTFWLAQEYNIGTSLSEPNYVNEARNLLAVSREKLTLPIDVCVLNPNNDIRRCPIQDVRHDECILDIGDKTIEYMTPIFQQAQCIFWNGPLGKFEVNPFHQGTVSLVKSLHSCLRAGIKVVVGGGETIAALHQAQNILKDSVPFTHLSTAGGAFLKALEGAPLPGVRALEKQRYSTPEL